MANFCTKCGKELKKGVKFCESCGASTDGKVQPEVKTETKSVKPKKTPTWLIVLVLVFAVIFFVGIIGSSSSDDDSKDKETYTKNKKVTVVVTDFSEMTEAEIDKWCNEKKINCKITSEYSDTVDKDKFIEQSVEADKEIYEGEKITITYSLGKEPSAEYKAALKKAESYSETLHMSKKGIYDQLISEYGEGFPKDAAQYAVDNMKADWNANALAKAESYSETMYMSKKGIYDQLVSSYGEKFTKEEAQYAIDNIEADWKANAVEKAKSYRETMNMSKKAIYDQLVSSYGEKFTKEEAQYGVDHMDD
jgi:hypothetical protein